MADDILFRRLCQPVLLSQAWQQVKEKNTAGGIDRKSVEDYATNVDKYLNDLNNQLANGKYVPQPYKETFIPKNANEKRRLGLLTVNDKIVQTAVYLLINPIFEREFLRVSYGYRSRMGSIKAVKKVQHLIINEQYKWLAYCDIDNFFDTIPHNLLFGRLSAFLKSPGITELIKVMVTMGRVDKNLNWKDSNRGIPQGGVISPLLANFYLHPFDKAIVEKKYGFVRYADDFILLGKTESEAKWALNEAVDFITSYLHLKLNDGAAVIPVAEGFEFLGIYFENGKLSLSGKKFNRLVFKLNQASKVGSGFVTQKFRDVLQGIHAFYPKLVPQEILSRLDDELMSILRLKAVDLNPGQNKIAELMNEAIQIEFLSHKNNFQRIEYVRSYFAELVEIKRRKPKHKGVTGKVIKSEKAVALRKHQYKKLEADQFDLVLSTPGLVVGKRENKLVVKKNGIVVQEVDMLNLKNVTVLCDGIGFSSNVVQACTENKISIDFLKHDGLPYAILHAPVYFDAETGLAQLEAYKNGKGLKLARKMIYGKISNQLNLIKYYGKYNVQKSKTFAEKIAETNATIKTHAKKVKKLDDDNLDTFRQSLFGIEGQASARYWETMQLLINKKAPFEGRERQGATDLVNCMLNYGYGILYSRISEALVKARLNLNLSYLHKPEKDRPSLVYDLIEEFRQQAVDRAVFAIIAKNSNLKVTEGQLDERTKKLVATKVIHRLNTVEDFRGREMRLFEIIQHQAVNVAAFLSGSFSTYKPYIKKW
jgi:group II intron reverse transcriptase/maturase/CRISPR-associated endonuclease Cas1